MLHALHAGLSSRGAGASGAARHVRSRSAPVSIDLCSPHPSVPSSQQPAWVPGSGQRAVLRPLAVSAGHTMLAVAVLQRQW